MMGQDRNRLATICIGSLYGTLAVLAWAAVTTPLWAEQLTLQPVKDNTLIESTTGSLSNGAGQYLFVGRTNQGSGSHRRAVIAFDLTAIPGGATISGVTLTLNLNKAASAAPITLSLHRLNRDWGEGGSNANAQEGGGAPAAGGDATWIHRFYPQNPWNQAGGDYASSASASREVGGPAKVTWTSTPQLVADVQGWIDNPTSNFGWILLGDESQSGTSRRFDSREASDASRRPTLTVTYAPAPTDVRLDRFFFPLFGDGAGLSTSLLLLNVGGSVTAHLDAFDRSGAPIPLTFDGLGSGSAFEVPLASGEALSATSSGTGDGAGGLQIGYLAVEIWGPPASGPQAAESPIRTVGGTAIFTTRASGGPILNEAGVPAADLQSDFSFYLDSQGQKDTGLALLFPAGDGPSPPAAAVVTLTARDRTFHTVLGTVERTLNGGEALGQFVYEIFRDGGASPALVQQLREIEAVVTVHASEPVAAVSLRLNGTALTTFPVIPGRADSPVTQ